MSYPLVRIARQSNRLIGKICPSSSSSQQQQHYRSFVAAASARSDLLALSSPLESSPSGHSSATTAASSPHYWTSRRFLSSEAPNTDNNNNNTEQATTASDSNTSSPSSDSTASPPPSDTLYEFKAETRQLLDIVTNSLYADKEVFLRELISNASDALEKLRHVQSTNAHATLDPDVPLEIRIETDEENGILIISDTGIGMTREDMVSNLGTIARSGSKAWLKELERKAKEGESTNATRGIIGKFGVGFYSAFMVGEKVEVRSKSALVTHHEQDPVPKLWTSDGSGVYQINNLDENIRQSRGVSVVIHLKDDNIEFCDEARVEDVITRYSNFVNFPIYLNGNLVNIISAIWTQDPKDINDDTYREFYQYIANATDDPLDTLHFRAEAPIDVKALLFIPSFHSEKYGMGRMDPGVSLYSRKVLIEHKSPDILPDWLRFLKGVVDSEDLPLAISREKAQDSNLIAKLRKALTRKFISHIANMAKKDSETYLMEFYKEYSFFLKEGICHDYEFQESLSKLLYFESSKMVDFQVVSLEEYIARCRPEQKDIYYLNAPSRELACLSPYMEAFDKAGIEVLFVFTAIDEFCMSNLKTFQGRNLVNIEKSNIDLSDFISDDETPKNEKEDEQSSGSDSSSTSASGLSIQESGEFCTWFSETLGEERVSRCKTTKRLTASPAVITDNESGSMRRLMRMVESDSLATPPIGKQQVEINPNHPIIVGLNRLRRNEPTLAKILAEQIYDNCVVAAGLMDDSRAMLPRLNDIMLCVVQTASKETNETTTATTATATRDDVGGEEQEAEYKDISDAKTTVVEAEYKDKSEETVVDSSSNSSAVDDAAPTEATKEDVIKL